MNAITRPSLRRRTVRRVHRAFSIIELLVVIGLLGAFMLLLSQFLNIERATLRATTQTQQIATQFDSMVSYLRRDIWSASTMAVDDDGALSVTSPDGQTVRWHANVEGLVSREASAEAAADTNALPLQWTFDDLQIRFEPSHVGVELHLLSTAQQTHSTIVLVSQIQLEARGAGSSSGGDS